MTQQLNDLKHKELTELKYTGTLDHKEFLWLGHHGCTTGTLNDRWKCYFKAQGLTGTYNEMLFDYLTSKGCMQKQLNDKLYCSLKAGTFYGLSPNPRVLSSIIDPSDEHSIIITWDRPVEMTCDVKTQFDVSIVGKVTHQPHEVTLDAIDHITMKLTMTASFAYGDIVTWTYDDSGHCIIQEIASPNGAVLSQTSPVSNNIKLITADAVVLEAFVEDGVPYTIIARYDVELTLELPFDKHAILVHVNGLSRHVTGVGLSPVDPTELEINIQPHIATGDKITFQYNASVDDGLYDAISYYPVDDTINVVENKLT